MTFAAPDTTKHKSTSTIQVALLLRLIDTSHGTASMHQDPLNSILKKKHMLAQN